MTPRRVLVVVTRRIGDVLLATPVIRSLRRQWPQAVLEALVFRGTEGVLAGNRDLDRVITVPERPRLLEHLRFHAALARRYDLALSLLTGDRPTLYAWLAGKMSAGLQDDGKKARWKRALLDRWVAFDDLDTHTVRMNLALVQALGLAPLGEVVVSWTAEDIAQAQAAAAPVGAGAYAVLQPCAKFSYKMWHLDGWTELGLWLRGRGLELVITGGGAPRETEYAAALAARLGGRALNLVGCLSLGAVGYVLSRAAAYVGPDTAVTHMAAALGTPTAALFGPSNPVKWGPWPRGQDVARNPWRRIGVQQQGNVALVQGSGACVPCLAEGCERHVASLSACLQELPARRVISALELLVATRASA
jgi:heptosyltransferase III